jgi:hypothetical protein
MRGPFEVPAFAYQEGIMSIAEFYAVTHWRNLYGIKGPFYSGGHHGHDIACAGREKIPCYRGGTVQPWRHSSVVGLTLAIRHGLGDYSGYCHLYNRTAKPGTVVAAGSFIAEAATWGDFTGSAWLGPHVHTVAGNSAACVFGMGTRDPAPYIRAAIVASSTASSNRTEINMALDAADKSWLNGMGQSIIDQLRGRVPSDVWSHPLTHENGTTGPARQWLMNTSDMVGAIRDKPSTVIDASKLAAELTKAGLKVTIDAAALVEALDKSLKDDFAGIPAAVRSEIIK